VHKDNMAASIGQGIIALLALGDVIGCTSLGRLRRSIGWAPKESGARDGRLSTSPQPLNRNVLSQSTSSCRHNTRQDKTRHAAQF